MWAAKAPWIVNPTCSITIQLTGNLSLAETTGGKTMAKRSSMSRSSSSRNFRRGTGTHKKNLGGPMRGGIRL